MFRYLSPLRFLQLLVNAACRKKAHVSAIRFLRVVGTPCLNSRTKIFEVSPTRCFSSLLFLRYVDNRLILAPSRILQHPQIRNFCLPDFYEGIQLESVEDHQWLEFTIDAPARTAISNLPTKPWQIRSPASAGSWRLAASGFSPEQRSFANTLGPKSQHCRR